jgi:hypothetical protein
MRSLRVARRGATAVAAAAEVQVPVQAVAAVLPRAFSSSSPARAAAAAAAGASVPGRSPSSVRSPAARRKKKSPPALATSGASSGASLVEAKLSRAQLALREAEAAYVLALRRRRLSVAACDALLRGIRDRGEEVVRRALVASEQGTSRRRRARRRRLDLAGVGLGLTDDSELTRHRPGVSPDAPRLGRFTREPSYSDAVFAYSDDGDQGPYDGRQLPASSSAVNPASLGFHRFVSLEPARLSADAKHSLLAGDAPSSTSHLLTKIQIQHAGDGGAEQDWSTSHDLDAVTMEALAELAELWGSDESPEGVIEGDVEGSTLQLTGGSSPETDTSTSLVPRDDQTDDDDHMVLVSSSSSAEIDVGIGLEFELFDDDSDASGIPMEVLKAQWPKRTPEEELQILRQGVEDLRATMVREGVVYSSEVVATIVDFYTLMGDVNGLRGLLMEMGNDRTLFLSQGRQPDADRARRICSDHVVSNEDAYQQVLVNLARLGDVRNAVWALRYMRQELGLEIMEAPTLAVMGEFSKVGNVRGVLLILELQKLLQHKIGAKSYSFLLQAMQEEFRRASARDGSVISRRLAEARKFHALGVSAGGDGVLTLHDEFVRTLVALGEVREAVEFAESVADWQPKRHTTNLVNAALGDVPLSEVSEERRKRWGKTSTST